MCLLCLIYLLKRSGVRYQHRWMSVALPLTRRPPRRAAAACCACRCSSFEGPQSRSSGRPQMATDSLSPQPLKGGEPLKEGP